jgi:hypothetical protein
VQTYAATLVGLTSVSLRQKIRPINVSVTQRASTPKARLGRLEALFLAQPWNQVREGIEVKLMAEGRELYLLTQSRERVNKERAMRRRQLKALCKRLSQLQGMKLRSQALLLKLGEPRASIEGSGANLKRSASCGNSPHMSFDFQGRRVHDYNFLIKRWISLAREIG